MDDDDQMPGGQKDIGDIPIWVGEIEIATQKAALAVLGRPSTAEGYGAGRVMVRFRSEPLGMMTMAFPDRAEGEAVDATATRDQAIATFRDQIVSLAGPDWSPCSSDHATLSDELLEVADADLPAVSVVIGTRNRPHHVVDCVNRVLGLDYPADVEVIVVDNGPSDTSTATAVEDAFGGDERVRYLSEDRPGLSRARNIGLAAARHPITAFLSDDIRVDRIWLLGIARGFGRHDAVNAVTGSCPPLFLDTPEQRLFESSMAWGTRLGFEPVVYRFDSDQDPIHPYRPGSFVNGSNVSFRTDAFRAIGGFDERLGPGTRARGGEDLDAPIRILADGGLVAYEPAVIGWHADTYDDRSFSKHMYTYGLGLTAFLAKHVLDKRTRRSVLRRIPRGLPLLLKAFGEPDEDLSGAVSIPLKYHLWHLAGRVAGPFAYVSSARSGDERR